MKNERNITFNIQTTVTRPNTKTPSVEELGEKLALFIKNFDKAFKNISRKWRLTLIKMACVTKANKFLNMNILNSMGEAYDAMNIK